MMKTRSISEGLAFTIKNPYLFCRVYFECVCKYLVLYTGGWLSNRNHDVSPFFLKNYCTVKVVHVLPWSQIEKHKFESEATFCSYG